MGLENLLFSPVKFLLGKVLIRHGTTLPAFSCSVVTNSPSENSALPWFFEAWLDVKLDTHKASLGFKTLHV